MDHHVCKEYNAWWMQRDVVQLMWHPWIHVAAAEPTHCPSALLWCSWCAKSKSVRSQSTTSLAHLHAEETTVLAQQHAWAVVKFSLGSRLKLLTLRHGCATVALCDYSSSKAVPFWAAPSLATPMMLCPLLPCWPLQFYCTVHIPSTLQEAGRHQV